MARVSRANVVSQDPGEAPSLLEALAPLASGVNADGTAYTLPISFDAALVPAAATGSMAAVNDAVTVAVDGMGSAAVELRPTATAAAGVITFEISYDGGTNWHGIQGSRPLDAGQGSTYSVLNNSPVAYEFGVPAMATHFRARCSTAITAGQSVAARVAAAPKFIEPITAIQGFITASSTNNNIGGVTKAVLTQVESAPIGVTLAAGATGFGTTRDLQGVNAGTFAAGNGRYPDRFRGHVTADQPFTLGIEYDVTTPINIPNEAGNVASTVGRGGRYFASLEVPVHNRYGRLYVTNTGASAMTNLRAYSTAVG